MLPDKQPYLFFHPQEKGERSAGDKARTGSVCWRSWCRCLWCWKQQRLTVAVCGAEITIGLQLWQLNEGSLCLTACLQRLKFKSETHGCLVNITSAALTLLLEHLGWFFLFEFIIFYELAHVDKLKDSRSPLNVLFSVSSFISCSGAAEF